MHQHGDGEERALRVPPYARTGGRTRAAVELPIAELSAHLRLPIGVVRVVVGDLVDEGLLRANTGAASIDGGRPDITILERVLDGLRTL
jgi:hypothetical protein